MTLPTTLTDSGYWISAAGAAVLAMAEACDEALRRGYASSAAVPLSDQGHVIGALNIYASEADAFDAEEMDLRRKLRFPPFWRLVRLLVRGRDRKRVEEAAARAADTARACCGGAAEVLGPAECPLAMIAGNHRVHVLLRGERLGPVHEAARAVRREWRKGTGVYLEIDVDPVSLL